MLSIVYEVCPAPTAFGLPYLMGRSRLLCYSQSCINIYSMDHPKRSEALAVSEVLLGVVHNHVTSNLSFVCISNVGNAIMC